MEKPRRKEIKFTDHDHSIFSRNDQRQGTLDPFLTGSTSSSQRIQLRLTESEISTLLAIDFHPRIFGKTPVSRKSINLLCFAINKEDPTFFKNTWDNYLLDSKFYLLIKSSKDPNQHYPVCKMVGTVLKRLMEKGLVKAKGGYYILTSTGIATVSQLKRDHLKEAAVLLHILSKYIMQLSKPYDFEYVLKGRIIESPSRTVRGFKIRRDRDSNC